MHSWRRGVFVFAVFVLSVTDRPVLAQTLHTLSTGSGDGSLTVEVNAFGGFGNNGSTSNPGNATYDPLGPVGPASTTYESWLAFRIGPTGSRVSLNGAASAITGTPTSCTSTFTMGSLSFALVQTVAPTFLGSVQNGSVLTQTYTITNTGTSSIDFELVRYFDGDLFFDSTLTDGGGRLAGPPETLFETDKGGTGSTSTTFVGIQGLGGTIPTSNRYEAAVATLRGRVLNGLALADTIHNDNDADGFVDAGKEYDVHLALRNVFTLNPGQTVVYTATTIFGSGLPSSTLPGLNVVQSAGSTNVAEGGSGDSFTVSLNSAPTANVTVTLAPDAQLTVSPLTLTFTPGNWNVPQTVTVNAVDDTVVEGNHAGVIALTTSSTDSSYNAVAVPSVIVSISDNDTAPVGLEGVFGGGQGANGPEGNFGARSANAPPVLAGPFNAGAGSWAVYHIPSRQGNTATAGGISLGQGAMAAAAALALAAIAVLGVRLRGRSG